MKKAIILIIFIIIIYLFLNNNNCSNKLAKKYFINNKSHCLLMANNKEDWEKGLMFYKKPVDFDGMVFIFPDKQIRTFWNKNTYLDLDIYWMDGERVMGKSHLSSISKSGTVITVNSKEKVDRVVEIVK